MTSGVIKSAPVLPTSGETSGKKTGRKLVRAISAESIYRCMLLFLDHILYRRAHFVRDALRASRAALAINAPKRPLNFNEIVTSFRAHVIFVHFSIMCLLCSSYSIILQVKLRIYKFSIARKYLNVVMIE